MHNSFRKTSIIIGSFTLQVFAWKAIRFIRDQKADINLIGKEISILGQLSHEHVVKYYGYAIDCSNYRWQVYIIMEYCEGGNLRHLIERTIENRSVNVAKGENFMCNV